MKKFQTKKTRRKSPLKNVKTWWETPWAYKKLLPVCLASSARFSKTPAYSNSVWATTICPSKSEISVWSFFIAFKSNKKKYASIEKHIQLRSSYFLVPTRRHCSTMAHFPINGRNGRNGCNGLTGWMQLHRHKCISLPRSRLFSMLKNGKSTFFPFGHDLWHKKALFYSRMWLIVHGYENGKILFLCHTGREQTKNNVLSHSSTCRESLNEKVMECSCVCVIVFTQSAHGTHSAHSAHLWGKSAMVLQWRRVWARK